MVDRYISDVDVVTMARRRIKNTFESAREVVLSVSGGKDSICLNDLIFKMCVSSEIDKSKLTVYFVDEEAVYPCIDRIVRNMRTQWMSIGVKFVWWCIQVRHYNCFNQLTNDESFICWDETKKDVWVRPRPKFAVTSDPLLRERVDTYQSFMDRKNAGKVVLIGIRAAESIHRLTNMANIKGDTGKIFPIYDWKDTDVWKYIREENLDFPEAYIYMYQVGLPRNRLRISQFFSIDTAGSLVQMCEYYPNLFDKICAREPNAYMAMLYYDSEMFRRGKKSKGADPDQVDYRSKALEAFNEAWRFESKSAKKTHESLERLLIKYGPVFTNKDYKTMYQIIVAGDPKERSRRALEIRLLSQLRGNSK